jgi:DNA repair protein RadA/Sms
MTLLDGSRKRERRARAEGNGHVELAAKSFDKELEPDSPQQLPELDEVDAEKLAAEGDDQPLDFLPLLNRDGYIVRGWSHLVAGYPRTGKTELLVECIPMWLRGGLRVLYFTEELRAMWKRRLRALPGPWKGLRLVFGLGAQPLDLRVRMADGPEEVVIIDTARNLGLLPDDENDNAAMAAAVTPWVASARKAGKTLIISHHMRKGAGEHGEGISGGHALLGCVDIALELRRDNLPNRRTIRGYARLIQPEELLYERNGEGRLVALGRAGGFLVAEVRRRVAEVLTDEWATTSEVREMLDPQPSQDTVTRALQAEAEAGYVERKPPLSVKSTRGRTVRWRRPAEPPQ